MQKYKIYQPESYRLPFEPGKFYNPVMLGKGVYLKISNIYHFSQVGFLYTQNRHVQSKT